MKGSKMAALVAVVGIVLAAASSAFAIGGVLPNGSGTNVVYGELYGQGIYYLQDFKTFQIDGAGITNIPVAGVVGAVATNDAPYLSILQSMTNFTPVASSSNYLVYDPATRSLSGCVTNIGGPDVWSTASNAVWSAINSKIDTNATPQSKAGKLTLNGGLTVEGLMSLGPSAVQTIAAGAAIASDAANVKVAGDGGAVTATIADGTLDGQVLTIRGTSDANSVTLTNAVVVPTFKLGLNDVISFTFVKDTVATNWVEVYRRDN